MIGIQDDGLVPGQRLRLCAGLLDLIIGISRSRAERAEQQFVSVVMVLDRHLHGIAARLALEGSGYAARADGQCAKRPVCCLRSHGRYGRGQRESGIHHACRMVFVGDAQTCGIPAAQRQNGAALLPGTASVADFERE